VSSSFFLGVAAFADIFPTSFFLLSQLSSLDGCDHRSQTTGLAGGLVDQFLLRVLLSAERTRERCLLATTVLDGLHLS
jgi:hypothetical protein